MGARILLVEDNPLTRQVLRDVLAMGGFEVLEAEDGATAIALLEKERPDLVLQDMLLPDCEGPDLLRRLRATPGGRVPIVALSGLPDSGESYAVDGGGFNDYLEKPIAPSALLMAVRSHIESSVGPSRPVAVSAPAAGLRIVVVLPLDRLDKVVGHLEREGYAVTAGTDGTEALAEIRRLPPAALVTGCLVDGIDGPALCHALGRDPETASLPVVLAPGSTLPPPEELVQACGAAAVAPAGASPGTVAEVLAAALAAGAPDRAGHGDEFPTLHRAWLRRTATHHARAAADLRRRNDLQAAALSILDVLATSLGTLPSGAELPRASELLARCLTTAGTSRGAAFLRDGDGTLRLEARIGFMESQVDALSRMFGHLDLLERVVDERIVVVVPGPEIPGPAGDALLSAVGARSLILVPVGAGDNTRGALLVASARFDLVDWVEVTRAVAFQVSQALELGNTVRRLAASEVAHRNLFDQSILGIYRSSGSGQLVAANATLARLLGYDSVEELLGQTLESIYRHPEERARLLAKYRGAQRFDGLEVDWVRRDGSPLTVRLSGRAWRDGSGRHGGFEVFVEDITGRRELEEEIRQAQRMEAVRRLASGVAHEYRNILTAVAGHADLLLTDLDPASPLRAHAEAIQRSVETAEGMTRDLLAFGVTREGEPRVVDLDEQVDRALPTLRRAMGEGIDLRRERSGRNLYARLDPARWEQALLFLVLHARENMPDGGTLTVVTGEAPQDLPGAAPRVVVEFRDTGRVLEEEERAHLLEPRFGEERGGGTAGLAAVYGLVREAGGQVAVLRGADGGTRIRILLPAVADGGAELADEVVEADPSAPVTVEAPRPDGVKETILVAEDEEAVRGLVAATLRREGYHVLEASNGEEALKEAAQYPGPLHLLLTDVVMPRVGGRRLAATLRASNPGLPVLFVSGYTEHASVEEEGGARLDEGDFLQKPFTPRVLAARVREVLDAAARRPRGAEGPEAGDGS